MAKCGLGLECEICFSSCEKPEYWTRTKMRTNEECLTARKNDYTMEEFEDIIHSETFNEIKFFTRLDSSSQLKCYFDYDLMKA